MDWDTVKTVADIGLGAIALVYVHRAGRILQNHEVRITVLEKHPRRKPRRRT
jgi:hypothetical protein